MKPFKRILLVTLSILLIVLGFVGSAMAAEENEKPDHAGNILRFSVDTDHIPPCEDLYWSGVDLNLDGVSIASDILGIGKGIDLKHMTLGSSLRAVIYSLKLTDVTVKNNITVAGVDMTIDRTSKTRGVYLVGATIRFEGEADELMVFGEDVYFDGIVHGDVTIESDNVVFGENLQVDGTLKVVSKNEPTLSEKAMVGNYTFEAKSIRSKTEEAGATSIVKDLIKGLLSALLLAAILIFLRINNIDECGTLLRTRPVLMIVTGIITVFLVPGMIVFLILMQLSLTIGIVLAGAVMIIGFLAQTMIGCAVGRVLLPKLNAWLSALIGAGVFFLIGKIPYFGIFWTLCCVVLLCGWLVQKIWSECRWRKENFKNSKLAELFVDTDAKATTDETNPDK